MGRPKGSKNTPKVTKALIGEVINKPKLMAPAAEKELKKAVWTKVTEEIDNQIIADIKKVAEQEGQEATPKKKLPKPIRDVSEKVDFIIEDLQSLRNYMCRFEDAFAAARKSGVLIEVPEKLSELKTKKYANRKQH
jgi:hypothetical protein